MSTRIESTWRHLRTVPAAAWVGVSLVAVGAILDVPYHLAPQSTLAGLAVAWGLAPEDFFFVISQVSEIGHFLIFGGLFFIAAAVVSARIADEERRQHRPEA